MKKVLLISLALVLALAAMAGCGKKVLTDADGNRVEMQGDTITVKGEDGDAEFSVGGNLSWPNDKMGGLPELGGNIIGVIDTPQGTSVTYEGISKSDYQSYVSNLKAQGYEAVTEMDMEGTILFMGQKGDNAVSIQLHLDSGSDKGSCIIIYGENL